MKSKTLSGRLQLAANQNLKEQEYWLDKLSGELRKSKFPEDFNIFQKKNVNKKIIKFNISGETFSGLIRLSNGSDITLHMVLSAVVSILIYKYTDNKDIIIGTPIYRQEIEGEFINTVLAIRNYLEGYMTFKELLLRVRDTVMEAVKYQDYPIQVLAEKLGISSPEQGFSLFDVVVILENIQSEDYLKDIDINIIFSFINEENYLAGKIKYNPDYYKEETIRKIADSFCNLLSSVVLNTDIKISDAEFLPAGEKNKILFDFNDNKLEYPRGKTLFRLFEEQVERTPDNIAVRFKNQVLSYIELNEKANKLARVLKNNGVENESIVGIMVERSLEMIIALIAILKAGGAYLPIDSDYPEDRILYMLENSRAEFLISKRKTIKNIPYTTLENLNSKEDIEIVVTGVRQHIEDFDALPMPDRSLINLNRYKNKIGMASVTNCISIQSTRGCPYKCVYCHKVWSKNHVFRSAENIYHEIEYYNKNGVKNFAFIDDCFNLDQRNSKKVFELIIKNHLDVHIFFPNGLRGDLLTPEYIDLMAEAGTCNINLSLETASPRLQKIIKKHLNLEKFRYVMEYIAANYPEIILEIATMHGFPGETEEEALMTLEFIKSIEWIHFPYIHILKIYPNTEMEELALKHGVSKEDILNSRDRAFHELPETLPFPKSFTRKYQADFMNNYFLAEKRLKKVIPIQLKVLSEEALIQKYDAYLPAEIRSIQDIINFAGLKDPDLAISVANKKDSVPEIFDRGYISKEVEKNAKKILFLDLSQYFSSHDMMYNVVEQPLGLLYLLTFLKKKFRGQIDGRIYKSSNDFDSFTELRELVEEYQPDLIGIRALTFHKDFFHETVSLLKQWGIKAPIIAGGPYATSDYDTVLRDKNVDIVIFGEGEYTLAELVEKMFENNFRLPGVGLLEEIEGIGFVRGEVNSRNVLLLDNLQPYIDEQSAANLNYPLVGNNLAYVMYTSGSTGRPKGVMVEHRQVNNCIFWMDKEFNLNENDIVLQRTNLTFDPSVWEIFWPLYTGGSIMLIDKYQSKDAEFLIKLISDNEIKVMYCPSSLIKAVTYLLNDKKIGNKLKMPLLIIGAEPISPGIIRDLYSYCDGEIVNTYGPTETTINNTYYHIKRGREYSVIPIGYPVANNNIYILSDDLKIKPVGVSGEICITGDSVARGYINNLEKTKENFIENPFGKGKLYRTGDIGRWLDDGSIEIMGRVDDQVKVRGYRIELGEIENALLNNSAINNCTVVVRGSEEDKAEINSCKICGITTEYPGVSINNDGFCEICENLSNYKGALNDYFGDMEELEREINRTNEGSIKDYDCLLLYSGGLGSGYALYQLLDRGFKVLAATYDHGYFSKADLSRIKDITSKLAVDHIILNHDHTDDILRQSIESAGTVCKGCFYTSSSLAGEYAYHNNINVVVGPTLSRGQIIENKLFFLLKQGINDLNELEKEILKIQKGAPDLDKDIFDYIDINIVDDRSLYDRIKFIDFYRYCDIDNQEMISYLENRDLYWKGRKSYAVYSTNCPLKQIGDYSFLKEHGFHYYGSATSWEKRLGHITLDNINEDLQCNVSQKACENFSRMIGYRELNKEDEPEKYICAYFVAKEEIAAAEIRESISKKLPGYMIPAKFVQLDEMPLTTNGKIDKKSLPVPDNSIDTGVEYLEPGNEIERKLAEIWQDELGIKRVGVKDDFFILGGDSIKAIKISTRLAREFSIDVPLGEIFKLSILEKLAGYIGDQDKSIYSEIEPVEKRDYYPVSSAQNRILMIEEFRGPNINYNIPHVMVVEGDLNVEQFNYAVDGLIKRHESLRTYFDFVEEKPVQKIVDNIYFTVEHSENVEEEIDDIIKGFIRPFNLNMAPLFRVGLIKTGQYKHILLFDMHHIISDGASMSILVRDFMKLYQNEKLDDLRIQYKDFAVWHNNFLLSDTIKKQGEYWLNKYSKQVAELNLPTDYPRSEILHDFRGERLVVSIERKLTDNLKKTAEKNGATLYMVLLAVYNTLLFKYTGVEDIVVGSPILGRAHDDLKDIIGVFINTLAVRSYPTGNKLFQEFIGEVKSSCLEAYENQDYQFEMLIENLNLEREISRNPLFDTMFVFQNIDSSKIEIAGLDFIPYDFKCEIAKLDLLWTVIEKKDGLVLSIEYLTSLFKKETIEKIAEHYLEILRQVINDMNIRLEDINISHDISKVSSVIDDGDFEF